MSFVNESIFSVPSIPTFSSTPCNAEDPTHQICVSWMKPPGGDAIDNYTLSWIPAEDRTATTLLINVDHNPNLAVQQYVIKNLLPGQVIFVQLSASNAAGTGNSSLCDYRTSKSI